MIGQTISHYRIVEKLGEGGMGVVYKAEDTKLERTVALKFLASHLLGSEEHKQRFLREAKAAASLDHSNICMVHEVGEADGHVFLAMGYVDGQELRGKIKERPLKLDEALDIAIQAAEGLRAAHQKGIVHRDIKSSNLMLTSTGQVKIMDFGLAQLTGGTRLTKTDTIVGTPAYMSPEQAQRHATDRRTDIWSLGVVLYEMVTGRLPFEGEREQAVVYSIVNEPHEPITALRVGVPTEVDRIVSKALAKNPDERYQHVEDMLVDLRALRMGQSARGAKAAPPRVRKLWWFAAAAVVAAVVVGIGASLWLRDPARPPGRDQWVQLTRFPDSAGQPALSADGRMLTFIRGVATFTTPGQVYVKMLPDGDAVQLTRDDHLKMSPVFSPDGSRIAYTVLQGVKWDTWTVPVFNAQTRSWLQNASGLTWFGKNQILFSEIKNDDIHMALVAAEESRAAARDVYTPASTRGMAHRSYVSPDGKWALAIEMDRGVWLPCRLVPMDGSSRGRQVGPDVGGCTFAGWSPDGKWMYLSSSAGGSFHTWRQRFPDGQPEQITSGPTEEEGIAVAPDGGSFVTAVALRQSAVWVRGPEGDRQISLEGYAYDPKFTPDGKRLCYRILKGAVPSDASELYVADLDSGQIEALLPGVSIVGRPAMAYDISADGRQIVAAEIAGAGGRRLWLVPLDRRSPPAPIPNIQGDNPFFGPRGEIVFRGFEGDLAFPYSVRADGTGLQKISEAPIAGIKGISPDHQWLVVRAPEKDARSAIVAISLRGEPQVRITAGYSGVRVDEASFKWSPDGKLMFILSPTMISSLGIGGKTFVIPVPAGRVFPSIPADGFQSEEELSREPGARVIDLYDVAPGPRPDVYAFSRETTQRNLYRIPIQ